MDGKYSQGYPFNAGVSSSRVLSTLSYYALMAFMMMLSVILLSMLIPLPTLNVIRHLICGNN